MKTTTTTITAADAVNAFETLTSYFNGILNDRSKSRADRAIAYAVFSKMDNATDDLRGLVNAITRPTDGSAAITGPEVVCVTRSL
jgi:hypothetical protein